MIVIVVIVGILAALTGVTPMTNMTTMRFGGGSVHGSVAALGRDGMVEGEAAPRGIALTGAGRRAGIG